MTKLLVIGDSISVDYRKYLQDYVGEDIKIFSKKGIEEAYKNLDLAVGANNGDSSTVLEYLEKLDKNDILKYDFCIFNCGLHDLKRDSKTLELQVSETLYEENLHKIIKLLQKNNIRMAFVTTTPSYRERYIGASFIRNIEDVIKYNEIAQKVMSQYGIKVLDLYRFTLSLGLSNDLLFRDHTHFTDDVIRLQAAYISGWINMFTSE